jgi:type II secretory pathway component PulF
MNDRALESLLRSLATTLRAGVGLGTVGPALLSGAPARARAALQRAITGGTALSEALSSAGLIDDAERALLAAGESGGRLPDVLDALARAVAERRAARSKLLIALAYPALLVSLAGFLLTAPLAITRGVGEWLSIAVWPALFVVTAGTLVLVVWPRLPRGSSLREGPMTLVSKLPLVGPQLKRGAIASALDILGQLVDAGLPYTLALPAALRAAGHADIRRGERAIVSALDRGATLVDALRAGAVFPERVLAPLVAGEVSGNVPKTLAMLARSERDAHRRFVLGSGVVIGMLAFAVVAGAIALTIISGGQAYIEQIDAIADEAER